MSPSPYLWIVTLWDELVCLIRIGEYPIKCSTNPTDLWLQSEAKVDKYLNKTVVHPALQQNIKSHDSTFEAFALVSEASHPPARAHSPQWGLRKKKQPPFSKFLHDSCVSFQCGIVSKSSRFWPKPPRLWESGRKFRMVGGGGACLSLNQNLTLPSLIIQSSSHCLSEFLEGLWRKSILYIWKEVIQTLSKDIPTKNIKKYYLRWR